MTNTITTNYSELLDSFNKWCKNTLVDCRWELSHYNNYYSARIYDYTRSADEYFNEEDYLIADVNFKNNMMDAIIAAWDEAKYNLALNE